MIVPELPGFGYGRGAPRFRLEDAPTLLASLMDRLDAAPAALVGHSLGALACLATAAATPERASALVLVCPPVRMASPRMAGNVLPAVRTLLALPPRAALTVAGAVARRSPVTLARVSAEILAGTRAGVPDAPPVPTMVVWGGRDTLVPVGAAATMARAMPDALVRVIPGAGHVPMLDSPVEITTLLRDFLAAR